MRNNENDAVRSSHWTGFGSFDGAGLAKMVISQSCRNLRFFIYLYDLWNMSIKKTINELTFVARTYHVVLYVIIYLVYI